MAFDAPREDSEIGVADDMGFETFRSPHSLLGNVPTVTIQKRGVMSLNSAARDALGRPDAVELMFDPERRLIGIRARDRVEPNTYPLRSPTGRESGTFVVSATAFLKHFEILPARSLRWRADLVDDILAVDLRCESTPVTSNRANAAAPVGRHSAK